MNKSKIKFDARLSKLDQYFTKQKLKLIKQYEGDRLDINFSRHFLERILERKLEKDLSYIVSMVEYFLDKIFYHTSHDNRRYMLATKHMRLGIAISTGVVSKHRKCTICTIFTDDNEEWFNDETINLKPNKT